VVLDEPTSHQDEAHAEVVADAVLALARAGSAVLVSTHDPRLVGAADRVVHLSAGSAVH
jgi:ABC-type lipoprotein export system ATPase subunit